MTNSDSDTPPADDDLRFDQASPDEGDSETSCGVCGITIDKEYFLVNEAAVCSRCRHTLETAVTESSGLSRFSRALGFGVIAAFLGSLLYFAIAYVTGYEIGLVAIVVGIMVGKAVSIGSHGKGGFRYQFLAVSLTYFAIVATYVPFIIEAIVNEPPAIEETTTAAAEPGEVDTTTPSDEEPTAADVVFAFAFLFALAAASPVLAGFENFIGILIIGFGLYQAWTLNRPIHHEVSGPYRVRPAHA